MDGDKYAFKRDVFVKEYLIDGNATRSAKAAGYSEKSAYSTGQRLLKNSKVQAKIQEGQAERAKRLDLSADMVVQQLLKIAFCDMKGFVTFGRREVPVMTAFGPLKDEDGNVVTKLQNFVDFHESASDEVDGTIIQEVSQGKDGSKIKTADRMKALELLGKHLGMWTEKLNLEGEVTVQVDIVD